MSKPRSNWQDVHGVLILDKALGDSSNHALQQVRRLLGARKAGHTGALDPMATGVLPLCFGEATKFSSYGLEADKEYIARLHLGYVSPTLDTESAPEVYRPRVVREAEILDALAHFSGEITQLPPMFSALKFQGKSLYEYAREGVEIERKLRQVQIFSLQLLAFSGEFADIRVHCSKGTYIRTLAADIGAFLGCGAYLAALRRTKSGDCDLSLAQTLAQLTAENCRDYLLPVDFLVQHLEKMILNQEDSAKILQGQRLNMQAQFSVRPSEKNAIIADFRLYAEDGAFLGLGQMNAQGQLQAKRLLANMTKN